MEKNYDTRNQLNPEFVTNQRVLVEWPSIAASAPSANSMKTSSCNKLQKRSIGPFKIAEVRSNIIGIDKDGLHNISSVHRVSQETNLLAET